MGTPTGRLEQPGWARLNTMVLLPSSNRQFISVCATVR